MPSSHDWLIVIPKLASVSTSSIPTAAMVDEPKEHDQHGDWHRNTQQIGPDQSREQQQCQRYA